MVLWYSLVMEKQIPATICRHSKLQAQMKVSSELTENMAVVTCKSCGFSVEIRGNDLTEPILLVEFNKEAHNFRLGRKTFSL